MHDVSSHSPDTTCDVSVSFNWPAVRDRCIERGAETHDDCARIMGTSLRTLDRLRKAPSRALLRTALRARDELGMSLDEMFPPQHDQQAAA